ncbi:MAG: hypothetical protein ACJAXA_003566 [Candidatus Aldehydirespiratoraceae bacterium]|jgi:hypothetical protein
MVCRHRASERLLAEARCDVEVPDVDMIRGDLEQWSEYPLESGLEARRIAIEHIAELRAEWSHVIVPKFLGRPDFVDRLDAFVPRCVATDVSGTGAPGLDGVRRSRMRRGPGWHWCTCPLRCTLVVWVETRIET